MKNHRLTTREISIREGLSERQARRVRNNTEDFRGDPEGEPSLPWRTQFDVALVGLQLTVDRLCAARVSCLHALLELRQRTDLERARATLGEALAADIEWLVSDAGFEGLACNSPRWRAAWERVRKLA